MPTDRTRPPAKAGLQGCVAAACLLALAAGCTPADPYKQDDITTRTADGIYHTVKKGETAWGIAEAYGVEVMALLNANDIKVEDVRSIEVGRKLLIPGATEEKTEPIVTAPPPERPKALKKLEKPDRIVTEPFFVRPVTGPIIKSFSDSTQVGDCNGLDIRVTAGASVLAAKSGIVVECAVRESWGKFILLDHGSGENTFYAHLASFAVSPGDTVRQGQTIGTAGTTGRATAPTLHFRIYRDGEPVDPRGRFSR